MSNLAKKVDNHDLKLNKQELRIIHKIDEEINKLSQDITSIKELIDKLKVINLYEVLKSDLPRDDELEILKKVFDKYGDITDRIVEIAKYLIDLRKKVEQELI
jgi:hypothetical protein